MNWNFLMCISLMESSKMGPVLRGIHVWLLIRFLIWTLRTTSKLNRVNLARSKVTLMKTSDVTRTYLFIFSQASLLLNHVISHSCRGQCALDHLSANGYELCVQWPRLSWWGSSCSKWSWQMKLTCIYHFLIDISTLKIWNHVISGPGCEEYALVDGQRLILCFVNPSDKSS